MKLAIELVMKLATKKKKTKKRKKKKEKRKTKNQKNPLARVRLKIKKYLRA
jgi:hypothetical protein